jgi:hypothetical protein
MIAIIGRKWYNYYNRAEVSEIKKQINIWVDEETYSAVKAAAEKRVVSMGWIAREALKRYLPKKKEK